MSTPTAKVGMAAAPPALDLGAAYLRCEEIVSRHYENFPVVSRFLPRRVRRSLAAVYAFARHADDVADEGYGPGGPSPAERLASLDGWEGRLLLSCGAGSRPKAQHPRPDAASRAKSSTVHPDADAPAGLTGQMNARADADAPAGLSGQMNAPADADAVFLALGDTIHRHDLDPSLFIDLLSAFRQDVLVTRYETRDDLLEYCRRSANPVGRIVLAVHGEREEARVALSDAICTGLQLANFWQDVAIDRAKDRVYLPRADRERCAVPDADLDARAASPALRALILEETAWARSFFLAGRPLLDDPPRGLGLHLGLVWHGGMRILERIDSMGGDVLSERPELGKKDVARLLLRAFLQGALR